MLLVASPPSSMKVFWSIRAPATVPPLELPSPVPPGPLKPGIAMGWSSIKAVASRLNVGMFASKLESSTSPTLASRVCNSTPVPAVTSTVSVIPPTSKLTLTRADFPTSTLTPLTTDCRKPLPDTVML